jgi:hypothetical protein
MNAKIIPTSKRAKERVKQHGEVMELLRAGGSFNGEPAILVQSLENTFPNGGSPQKWTGWLTEKEAKWEKAQ